MNISHKLRQIKIKKIGRAIVTTMATIALGLSVFFPTLPSRVLGEGSNSVPTPRFNFMENDNEMLQVGRNAEGNWSDPLSANIGDQVTFLLYYHNGILNSTAHNVSVRIDLPLLESSSLVSKSWLWSDETAAISDTVYNGQITGLSGATVNLPSNARIEYVSGSTKLFANGSQTGVSMPDGITTNSGLNIGNVQGCWNYAGYVTMVANIKAPAKLVMDKMVAHPGDNDWVKETTANPGDAIAYHLGIRNEGSTDAQNVTVTDRLPQYMTYVSGTTYLFTKDHPEGIKQGDGLFGTGVDIASIAPGQANVIYITYRVKIATNLPSGSFSFINLAEVFMGGVKQDQDQATVTVTASRGLVLDKKVSNGVSWVEESTSDLGGIVSYRLVVRNTGNVPIANVILRDALPVYVNYTFGSTTVGGQKVGDQIVEVNGLNIGTLAPGEEKIVILSGSIYGCPPIGTYTLVNTAYAHADSVVEIADSAKTTINVILPQAPVL